MKFSIKDIKLISNWFEKMSQYAEVQEKDIELHEKISDFLAEYETEDTSEDDYITEEESFEECSEDEPEEEY